MFLIAFVFLLLAALGGGRKQSQFLRADTRPLVGLLQMRNPTPKQLRAGAVYALGIGYTQAAQVLRERADFVDNVRKVAMLLGASEWAVQTQPCFNVPVRGFESPWPDVEVEAWAQYVRGSRLDADDRGSRDWLIGIFGLSPRALERIGIMADVKKDGDRWSGKWSGTIPSEIFLKSVPAQVQALTAISSLHRDESGDTLGVMVGQEIEGVEATLSGLLAVALRAGGKSGLESWVNNEADRRKFKRTTAAYLKQNGVF